MDPAVLPPHPGDQHPATGEPTGFRTAGVSLPPRLMVRHRRVVILALHLLLVPLGYVLAFVLRFDLPIPSGYRETLLATLPLLVGARLLSFGLFRLYSGWWRHVGMYDLVTLVKAVSVSSTSFVVLLFLTQQLRALPRSILLLDWMLAILFFGGMRFTVRWIREAGASRSGGSSGKRTLIVGAGHVGAHLLHQVRTDPRSNIDPVGIVDDDPLKRGTEIHGVRVLGTSRDLPDLVRRNRVELVVVAISAASREEMRRIVERCAGLGVEFKIVPSLHEMLDGRVRLSELRVVNVEDLLGRVPVSLHLAQVEMDLEGQVVVITGGAGSIGSELARQVAMYRPARLLLLEVAESPVYETHLELAATYPRLDIVPIVADVRDAARMQRIFATYRPDYVFHAAAYKHVPLMEAHVVEAVGNNVFGTLNVARSAVEAGVRKFVLISTDKAVKPSSVMGATKRIAERLVLGLPDLRSSDTDFRAVRFGNVLGSQGSVVPLFKRQIATGGPVTVTHPDMTRYFMTIPEACQLVLEASALPEAAGRVSMLEMGRPVRILDMAENLIRLSGLEPYTQVPIVYTGIRPGEKLHEELMSEVERTIPSTVEKICIVQTDEPDSATIDRGLESLVEAHKFQEVDALLCAIREMVPECVSPLCDTQQIHLTPSSMHLVGEDTRAIATPVASRSAR